MNVTREHAGHGSDRPSLCDYLLTAESEQLDIGLRLKLGAVDVGRIVVSGGEVVHAELPGLSGDAALELLAELGDVHVEFETVRAVERTVSRPWKATFADTLRSQGPGRAGRRARVCEELRRAGFSDHPEPSEAASEHGPANSQVSPALRTASEQLLLELLHREAIIAYLRGDLGRAQTAMRRGAALAGAPAYRSNLERLRLRILEEQGGKSR